MTRQTTVAVVVAVSDPPGPILNASLDGFAREVAAWGSDRAALLVVDGTTAGIPACSDAARVVRQAPGQLVPELWRNGIIASDADRVALTTGSMVPVPGWLGALMDRLDRTSVAGVGGPIAPGPDLSATDRAVALLRYSSYWPGRGESREPIDPPGDNALYRRDRLDRVRHAWDAGFWEVDVHRALRDQGDTLDLADEAGTVEFRGGCRLGSMLAARWRHARIYGRGRAAGSGWVGRWSRTVRAPLVPPLLLARIGGQVRRRGVPLAPWIRSGPALLALASAWAAGEAAGAWDRSP